MKNYENTRAKIKNYLNALQKRFNNIQFKEYSREMTKEFGVSATIPGLLKNGNYIQFENKHLKLNSSINTLNEIDLHRMVLDYCNDSKRKINLRKEKQRLRKLKKAEKLKQLKEQSIDINNEVKVIPSQLLIPEESWSKVNNIAKKLNLSLSVFLTFLFNEIDIVGEFFINFPMPNEFKTIFEKLDEEPLINPFFNDSVQRFTKLKKLEENQEPQEPQTNTNEIKNIFKNKVGRPKLKIENPTDSQLLKELLKNPSFAQLYKNAPTYKEKDAPTLINCKNCNKSFSASTINNKYCSERCRTKFHNQAYYAKIKREDDELAKNRANLKKAFFGTDLLSTNQKEAENQVYPNPKEAENQSKVINKLDVMEAKLKSLDKLMTLYSKGTINQKEMENLKKAILS